MAKSSLLGPVPWQGPIWRNPVFWALSRGKIETLAMIFFLVQIMFLDYSTTFGKCQNSFVHFSFLTSPPSRRKYCLENVPVRITLKQPNFPCNFCCGRRAKPCARGKIMTPRARAKRPYFFEICTNSGKKGTFLCEITIMRNSKGGLTDIW